MLRRSIAGSSGSRAGYGGARGRLASVGRAGNRPAERWLMAAFLWGSPRLLPCRGRVAHDRARNLPRRRRLHRPAEPTGNGDHRLGDHRGNRSIEPVSGGEVEGER